MPRRADSAKDRAFVERIGAWFDEARRDLPWRRTRDPYAIWLSEVMLQQTRVATVVDYYGRFLRRYPTVKDLADAPIDDVLGEWSGLGYYRRARALHGGAQEIVSRYGGLLPKDTSELESIQGIGRYTAGAIASIAYGVRAALVDGNVARVLSRVYGIDLDVRSPSGVRAVWSVAERLVPTERPGRHNEAIMELGATLCTPRSPSCPSCPLRSLCIAEKEGRQATLPRVSKKKPPLAVCSVALVCRRGDRVLVGRRIEGGLFGGLWEPPTLELAKGDDALTALSSALGWAKLRAQKVGTERRTLTHRKLAIEIWEALPRGIPRRAPRLVAPYEVYAWLTRSELASRGVSAVARSVLSRSHHPP